MEAQTKQQEIEQFFITQQGINGNARFSLKNLTTGATLLTQVNMRIVVKFIISQYPEMTEIIRTADSRASGTENGYVSFDPQVDYSWQEDFISLVLGRELNFRPSYSELGPAAKTAPMPDKGKKDHKKHREN